MWKFGEGIVESEVCGEWSDEKSDGSEKSGGKTGRNGGRGAKLARRPSLSLFSPSSLSWDHF